MSAEPVEQPTFDRQWHRPLTLSLALADAPVS